MDKMEQKRNTKTLSIKMKSDILARYASDMRF